MIEKSISFTTDKEDIFENLLTAGNLVVNHVKMKPGRSFPAHITECIVNIIVAEGTISIKLGDQQPHIYSKGTMVSLPAGVMSGLSNNSSVVSELFVVKTCEK